MARTTRGRLAIVLILLGSSCGGDLLDGGVGPVRTVELDLGGVTHRLKAVEIDGMLVAGGDMIVARAAPTADEGTLNFAIMSGADLWPGGVVPYHLDPTHPYADLITDALAAWQDDSVVRFVPRTTERDYVNFVVDEGACWSFVGMIGGAQDLSIGGECSAAHELGHALGALHEHQRPDRDAYIDILWDNIPDSWKHCFERDDADFSESMTPYDAASLMHYPSDSSLSSQPLLLTKDGRKVPYIWYPNANDLAAMNTLYGASSGPACGDGTCDAGEDCRSCGVDCGSCEEACETTCADHGLDHGQCAAGWSCSWPCAAYIGECPPTCGAEGWSGYRVLRDRRTWDESERACEAAGAHLVVIDRPEENDAVAQLLAGDFWIGLTDRVTEGQFLWVTPVDLAYTSWKAGEPNDGWWFLREDAAHMLGTGEWNDRSAGSRLPAICECDGVQADAARYAP